MKLTSLKAFLASLTVLASAAALADGRVDKGGDPLDPYISQTRKIVVETFRHIANNRMQSAKEVKDFCLQTREMTSKQADFCMNFILDNAQLMIDLNTIDPITPIRMLMAEKLKEMGKELEDFHVDDGDGAGERPISAMTKSERLDPIFVIYERVRDLPLTHLLVLLVHEMGHKLKVDDNPIDDGAGAGPFEKGRDLLDSMATTIEWYATRYQIIPMFRVIYKDFFNCKVFRNDEEVGTFTANENRKLENKFLEDQRYTAGVGMDGAGLDISDLVKVPELNIYFRLQIHEELGCQSVADQQQRYTEMAVWTYEPKTGGYDLGNSERQRGSPICEVDLKDERKRTPLVLEYKNEATSNLFRIDCQYEGYHLH